jgi:[ribosomal protein S18]-alanine N-acetyltransferase
MFDERRGDPRVHFDLRPMRWRDARKMIRWRYPAPYAIYDLHTAEMRLVLILHPLWRMMGVAHFAAVRDERRALVGMFQYMPHGSEIEIGLALRPDLTGQGLGLAFVRAGLAYGTKRFRPTAFRLNVALFNERARRVYERAGFRAVRTMPKRLSGQQFEVLEMVCDVADAPGSRVGSPGGAGERAGSIIEGRLRA